MPRPDSCGPSGQRDPGNTGRERPDIRVTVEDLASGETETVEIKDDYVILAAGSCHVAHIQAFGNGTHILTVKGRRDA